MMRIPLRNVLVMLTLLIAAGLGVALKPTERVGAPAASINLESIIPTEFADWRVDRRMIPILPPPDLTEKVEQLYDETLARTYVNGKGQYVMLSIAYGGDQTGRLRVHRPESCYSAQGFRVSKYAENELAAGPLAIPVKRLTAQSGPRHEPITYWIRVGDSAVTSLMGQRLTQLKFGLTGEIPDGLIFRVSSIDREPIGAYLIHDKFVADLMATLPPQHQAILIGSLGQAKP